MIFYLFGLSLPNTMFLLETPYESLPFINTWTVGSLALGGSFVTLLIYEHFKLEENDRWITKFKEKRKKNKK